MKRNIINYDIFLKSLKEGLITSHNINLYKHTLTSNLDQLKITYKLDIIDKLEFKLTLSNPTNDIIDITNHTSYVLGYYPSYCWVTLSNGYQNDMRFDNFKFSNNISNIIIKYESKYDDGMYNNTNICPDILYHLTPVDNKKSIFKKGIYPRSNSRLSVHPDRIYLFKDMSSYTNLLSNLKRSDLMNNIIRSYMLVEINCINRPLILHTDPNYRMGYFTYDHISPNDIKIIKDNL